MPNVDSTGKQGRSMDASQLLEFKKKYITLQQQNGKTPPGYQKQKPAFNSDHLSGGGSENGAGWYYNQKGNTLIYDRFFGNRSLTNYIDPRISELIAFSNTYSGVTTTLFRVVSLTANEITVTFAIIDNGTKTETFTLPLVTIEPMMFFTIVRETYYFNNTGGVLAYTTIGGFTRHVSNGQLFTDDDIALNMS